MISKKYLAIVGGVLAFGTVIMGIFMLTSHQPFTVQINDIDPADLGSEEWLEDIEAFYSFIEENYPFLQIKNRTHGYNYLDLKEYFEDQIKNVKDNTEFHSVMMKVVRALQNRHTYSDNRGVVVWQHGQ